MPAYGLATAAAVLVGMAKGEKIIIKFVKLVFGQPFIGVVILGFFGLFLFFGGAYFATFFTSDSSAIAQVGIALKKIDGFIQPVLAISLILAGALQGMGDTKKNASLQHRYWHVGNTRGWCISLRTISWFRYCRCLVIDSN